VITWTVNPANVRFMEERGIRVISLYPESIPELYEAINFQGRIFSKEKEMRNVIALMEDVFSEIKKESHQYPQGKNKKCYGSVRVPTRLRAVSVSITILSI